MTIAAGTPADIARIQRRTVLVLSAGQVLGGLAAGTTISLGALLAAAVSGDDALSGLATAALTLGSAAVAVPLAALARRRGRRISLTTGMLMALVGVFVVIGGAATSVFPVLLLGFLLVGSGTAVNLQSRFAAADLATDRTRGRDLSLVVWATTIGAVLGPNLVGPSRRSRCISGCCDPILWCSPTASGARRGAEEPPPSRTTIDPASRCSRSSRSRRATA
jgi:MFS family permease